MRRFAFIELKDSQRKKDQRICYIICADADSYRRYRLLIMKHHQYNLNEYKIICIQDMNLPFELSRDDRCADMKHIIDLKGSFDRIDHRGRPEGYRSDLLRHRREAITALHGKHHSRHNASKHTCVAITDFMNDYFMKHESASECLHGYRMNERILL